MNRLRSIFFLATILLLAYASFSPLAAQSSRDDEIEFLITKGWALSAKNRFLEALTPLNQALLLEADNPNILTLKGGALIGLKKYQEALDCLQKALLQIVDDPLALTYKGQALFNLGRFSEAASCFNRTAALEPNSYAAKAGLNWSNQKISSSAPIPEGNKNTTTEKIIAINEVEKNLAGAWLSNGRPTSITQDSSGNLVFTNEMGWVSKGRFANTDTVIATEWEGGLRGSLQDGGRVIRWANGTMWTRGEPGAGGIAPRYFSGSWSGNWVNSLGEKGTDSLVLEESGNGEIKGTWGGNIRVTGRRINETNITLQGQTQRRAYKVQGTIQGNELILRYTVDRLDSSGSYEGESIFRLVR